MLLLKNLFRQLYYKDRTRRQYTGNAGFFKVRRR